MGVCVHAHVCVCVFWFPIHELWLSVDDWEMERDRERRAVLVGRLLNSSFCSLNWICCGDTDRQEKRRNIYQFIRIHQLQLTCRPPAKTPELSNSRSCSWEPCLPADVLGNQQLSAPSLLLSLICFSSPSLYLKLSYRPVGLVESWAVATAIPLGHVRCLAAHLDAWAIAWKLNWGLVPSCYTNLPLLWGIILLLSTWADACTDPPTQPHPHIDPTS